MMDNTDGTAASTSPLFAMSGDGVDDIKIPMVFLFMKEARKLMEVVLEWYITKFQFIESCRF